MARSDEAAREALTTVAAASANALPEDEIESALSDEHVRYAIYVNALRGASPSVERDVISAVLTDPDSAMRESALVSYLDDRVPRMRSPHEIGQWVARVGDLFTQSAFLASRLQEWELLKRVEAGEEVPDLELLDSSDWFQRKLSDAPAPASVLRLLAERGRTRRVRAAARRRLP
jgi:hypothetical protein